MTWEYIALSVIVIVAILLVLFRKNPYVKKYWKYSLILIPLALVIVLSIIKKPKPGPNGKVEDDLGEKIEDLKDSLHEAQLETAVEVSAAKQKNKDTIEKLKEIKKIPDKKERIRRLAEMVG